MLSQISLIIGIVATLVSLITMLVAYIKNLKAIREGLKALLRNSMEGIYYRNCNTRTLKDFERKNLDSIWAAYGGGLHGNSWGEDMYNEMREWHVER